MRLGRRVMRGDAPAVARLLRSDPRVLWVEPDTVLHPLGVPNDTMYAQQWHYYESLGGINLPGAWDITTGSASITIAVIDTGVLPHAELAGRLVELELVHAAVLACLDSELEATTVDCAAIHVLGQGGDDMPQLRIALRH